MRLLLSLFFLFVISNLQAQDKSLQISGKVIDAQSGQPIEFATIMLEDTASQAVLTGTSSAADGSFQLSTAASGFQLKITFMGFQPKIIRQFNQQGSSIELGDIQLNPVQQTTDEVVVQAEKSQMEFQLDKRVFNVGQDLSSAGGSALDVLENVPSVDVNIEGQVSLRGSAGVQILINGKPSVIASEEGNALGSITADMIEKIEVITNPSAKYEAEGTAGIINIVLKKEERKGTNGSLSLNTGYPHNHSLGFSINRRTEKFNLFSQMGTGYRSLPRFRNTRNTNLTTGSILTSEGVEYRNEYFANVLLGADYHINDYNILTLTGTFAHEWEWQPSETTFEFTDPINDEFDEWVRNENTTANNPKWQYELQYKKTFKNNEEHVLLLGALGNFFGKRLTSDFNTTTLSGDRPEEIQQTATAFREAKYTFNLDYTLPIGKKFTLEAGSQYVFQDVSNDFSVSNFVNNVWVLDTNTTNLFEYKQGVLGVYSTGALELDKWGLKLGLRMEYTDLNTLLVTTNEANSLDYLNLFPSVHSSYKFSNFFSMQVGYSRRVYRPRLWDLNPFFNIRNNFSIRQGNPNLLPEFTDSYELTAIAIFKKVTLTSSVYYRYTTDVIERVSFFEGNVAITKPVNLGTTDNVGLELYLKYEPAKWLSLNGDVNAFYFNRTGTLEGQSFDFENYRWNANVTSKFKLPADFDLELTGKYRSAFQTVQGTQSANIFMNVGLRKKLGKGKYVLGLSVRDVFFSRFRETLVVQDDTEFYAFGQRGRFVRLNFSYSFGDGEAMEYSGRLRR